MTFLSQRGVELFDQFTRTGVFLHDDVWLDRPDDVDELSSHPSLLHPRALVSRANSGRLSSVPVPADRTSDAPTTVVSPLGTDRSLLSALLEDEHALDVVAALLRPADSHLSLFYGAHPRLNELREALTARLPSDRRITITPDPEVYAAVNPKVSAALLCDQAGVPQPAWEAVDDASAADALRLRWGTNLYLKATHSRTCLAQSRGDIEAFFGGEASGISVLACKPVPTVASPLLCWITWASESEPLFVNEQVLNGPLHIGNRPFTLGDDVQEQMIDIWERIMSASPNLLGVGGLDYIVDTSGRVILVDLNYRFNSCTYGYMLAERVARASDHEVYPFYRRLVSPCRPLEDYADLGDFPVLTDDGEGVHLFGDVELDGGELLTFCSLALSHDRARAERWDSAVMLVATA